MAFYFQTEDGQIQADLARRLKIVLKQYYWLVPPEDRYEVSLSLSILQTLLTRCVELLKAMDDSQKKTDPLRSTQMDKTLWGFNESNIVVNTFYSKNLRIGTIIKHVRNAMSHPTNIFLDEDIRTTGYTSVHRFGAKDIEKIRFIDSPDMIGKGRGKTRIFPNRDRAENEFNRFRGDFPEGVIIVEDQAGRFLFMKDGVPFHRVFEIDFSPAGLLQFTYALADYLSHPLKKDWDAVTFEMEPLLV